MNYNASQNLFSAAENADLIISLSDTYRIHVGEYDEHDYSWNEQL